MAIARTVSYEVKAGWPREHFREGLVEAESKLLCKWEERITLCRELLGYWYGGIYFPPAYYVPEGNEGLYDVYAYDCHAEPLVSTPIVSGLSYTKAIVTVLYKYQTVQNIGDGSVFITEAIEPAAEFLTLTRKGLYFGTGASKVPLDEDMEAPAMIIRMVDWVYTIHGVLDLGIAYYDLPGKVNDAAVFSRSLDRSFPAETLLCGNPSATRDITRDGKSVWTVTYRFTYKNHGTLALPLGWNHWPRTDAADSDGIDFERITDGTDNVPIYTLADFSGIVR